MEVFKSFFVAVGLFLVLKLDFTACHTLALNHPEELQNVTTPNASLSHENENSLKARAVYNNNNGQNGLNNNNNFQQGPVRNNNNGFRFPDGIPFERFLPFVQSGNCQRGTIYTITDGNDLFKSPSELECIFFSGISPNKVPEGSLKGTVLTALNTELFDRIVNLVWWGKFIKSVSCPPPSIQGPLRNRPVHIGWNNVLNHVMVPFTARIGPIQENLINGEINDGRGNFIIDYTQDFTTVCANFDELRRSEGINLPQRNLYPLNQAVDAIRLVGRQRDGGAILLGKTYLRDTSGVSSTVVYFYFINYDRGVLPQFQPGQQLPPLENSFKFNIPGFGPN